MMERRTSRQKRQKPIVHPLTTEPRTYRQKPVAYSLTSTKPPEPALVLVDAIQFTGDFDAIESFVGSDAEFREGQLIVATLDGALQVRPDDWIVRDARGAFTPVPPGIFAALYEPVEVAP